MYVRALEVVDFRSYQHASLTFDPGPSVLVGPNGEGKTNLMEAIGYVATLGSHRVSSDAPLVRSGATQAIVRANVVHAGRELRIELEINPGKANRARINRGPVPRPRDVLGILRTVLFAPEDLAVVRGDPAERRRFLDDLLVARAPRYAAVRQDYDRVLRQRNALLKTAGHARRAGSSGDLRTLDVWDGHLASTGAELLAGRLTLVHDLAGPLESAYHSVAPNTGAAYISYVCGIAEQTGLDISGENDTEVLAAALSTAIAESRTQEVERGITLVGPHRDDALLRIGDLPARGYASHGEAWSLALALRLASYELLRADGAEPVLILDDVFAELDTGRRKRLAELAGAAEQVLVTAAVPEDVPESLRGALFDVADGDVRRIV